MKVFINLSFHRKLIVIEKKQKTVAVFGAGIAGLTTAHKFSKCGYIVKVYESNSEAGGFSRSARRKKIII
jgi:protoporphyrinogen oxidase